MHKRRRNTLVSSASVLFLCVLRREEAAHRMQRFVEIFARRDKERDKTEGQRSSGGNIGRRGGARVSEPATSDGDR